MRHSTHVTSSRLVNRLQILSATLIGVVLLGGVATSAEDNPKKKAKRKTTATKTTGVPPVQYFGAFLPDPSQLLKRDPLVDPPYPAFFPNFRAEDEDLAFQQKIAKVLCEKAESYPGRAEHFSWLAENELYQKTIYREYGLTGHILEAKSMPGGWLVRVSVRPRVSAAGRVAILDEILEDYQYQDGVLTLIQTDAAEPKLDKQRYILH